MTSVCKTSRNADKEWNKTLYVRGMGSLPPWLGRSRNPRAHRHVGAVSICGDALNDPRSGLVPNIVIIIIIPRGVFETLVYTTSGWLTSTRSWNQCYVTHTHARAHGALVELCKEDDARVYTDRRRRLSIGSTNPSRLIRAFDVNPSKVVVVVTRPWQYVTINVAPLLRTVGRFTGQFV